NELTRQILQLINIDRNIEGPYLIPEKISLFDAISPLDFRYYGRSKNIFAKLQPYLSESAFIKYALKAESALAKALAKNKLCPQKIADEIKPTKKQLTLAETDLELKQTVSSFLTSRLEKVVYTKSKQEYRKKKPLP
ncbi:MAG: hypothetical protein AABX78_03285, partial [Nanoarchaeota archaeon]